MASRPELVECCIELELDWHGKSIEQMKSMIKKEADRRFNKRYPISPKDLSDTLLHFLVNEYDYKLKNKQGKEVKK